MECWGVCSFTRTVAELAQNLVQAAEARVTGGPAVSLITEGGSWLSSLLGKVFGVLDVVMTDRLLAESPGSCASTSQSHGHCRLPFPLYAPPLSSGSLPYSFK